MKLWEMTGPRCGQLQDQPPVVLVPIGSVEQHARHLPTGTDSIIVQGIAQRIEQARPETVLLAPPVWYGSSGHHLGFPGTTSVSSEHLVAQIVDVVSTLHRSTGLARFFVLNGHGGNQPAMRIALEGLRDRAPAVRAVAADYWHAMFDAMADEGRAHPAGMGHACEIETSLMLALAPDLVDVAAAVPDERQGGGPNWLFESYGFDRLSRHGGMGDPTRGDADSGNWMLALAVSRLVSLTDELAAA